MKIHSDYFQKVFLSYNDRHQTQSKELFEKIRDQYKKDSVYLVHQTNKSGSRSSNSCEKDFFDDILAITSSLNSIQNSVEKKRQLSLNHLKERLPDKYGKSNQNFEKKQSTSLPKYSKQQRKQSSSCQRRRKKLDCIIVQKLRKKILKHPSIFGKIKEKDFYKLGAKQNCQSSAQCKIINTEKVVLWTEGTLTKIIEEFYCSILNAKKQERNKKQMPLNNSVESSMRNYLLNKFKTNKLCRQNFINLSYSVLYHVDKTIEALENNKTGSQKFLSKIRYWQIFDRIINLYYQFEDVLFYLFARYLFYRIFNGKIEFSVPQNSDQVCQFFHLLSNKDRKIYQEYQKCFKKLILQSKLITRDSLLYFLLEDFKQKKDRFKIRYQLKQRNKQTSSDILNQVNLFTSNKSKFDSQFWLQPRFYVLKESSLFQALTIELTLKCERLLNILDTGIEQNKYSFILSLINAKSIRMLHAVTEMSKRKWLEELNYSIQYSDSEEQQMRDLEEIENLQKQFKVIERKYAKKQLSPAELSSFSKKLLTPRVFLIKLEQLINNLS